MLFHRSEVGLKHQNRSICSHQMLYFEGKTYTKFDFCRDSALDPAGGSLQHSTRPFCCVWGGETGVERKGRGGVRWKGKGRETTSHRLRNAAIDTLRDDF